MALTWRELGMHPGGDMAFLRSGKPQNVLIAEAVAEAEELWKRFRTETKIAEGIVSTYRDSEDQLMTRNSILVTWRFHPITARKLGITQPDYESWCTPDHDLWYHRLRTFDNREGCSNGYHQQQHQHQHPRERG